MSGRVQPCVPPALFRGAAQGNALPFLPFVPMALVAWDIFPTSLFCLLPCNRRLQSRRRGSHRRSDRRLRRSWPVAVGHPRRDADDGTPAATQTGRHCARQCGCSRLPRRRRSSLRRPPAIAAPAATGPLEIHAGRLPSPPRPLPPGGRLGVTVWGICGGAPPLLGIRAEKL